MDRREALAALIALPGLTTIQRADIAPDDVIVISTDRSMSVEAADRIKSYAAEIWPKNKIVVLSDGLEMKVLRSPNASTVVEGKRGKT